MAETVNAKTLYSIGAALRQVSCSSSSFIKKVVYGVVNRPEILDVLKKYNVTVLQGEGQITGFNGLILGLAKERGMDAMCILGEIDNPNMIQPKTAEAVLQVLINILGISSMNMLELEEEEKRKKFMEYQMSYLEKVMENGEPPGVA